MVGRRPPREAGTRIMVAMVFSARRRRWARQLARRSRAKGVPMEFVATCPKGFESLLAGELHALGAEGVRPLVGQVSFTGGLADAYRCCLWSRLASNVTLVLARVGAANADQLYEGLSAIPWEDHVAPGATMAIEARGTNDQLRNTQFVALRSKDAVADRLLSRRGARPLVNTDAPDVGIVVRLSRERALVGIDLTGEPLFNRGWEAPLGRGRLAPRRADYAAALLEAGCWFRDVRHGSPVLVDLFSGTGSVAVEAASQALDRAPGLLRTRWGFAHWAGHDAEAWDALATEAADRAAAGAENSVELLLCDTRPGAEAAARRALRAAGMDVEPRFLAAGELAAAVGDGSPLLVADLAWPQPDDLASEAEALSLFSAGAGAVAGHDGAGMVALSPDDAADAAAGGEPAETIAVILGRDDATIRCYDPMSLSAQHPMVQLRGDAGSVPVLVGASDQFAARLAKVAKLRAKWAAREDVSCYRVYDADLPDYAVSIDLYRGSATPGRWLYVSEYAAPRDVDAGLARRRLLDVLAIAPRVLDVDPANVHVRVRTRARGGSQYADGGREGRGPAARDERPARRRDGRVELPRGAHLVDEGGLTFEVNFSERLDCGLFLDHRETRSMLRELMKRTPGGSFLNLFAYTGTASCYAADGGAGPTTTVDLSRPSLDWARRNMERNGFVGRNHEFIQADVLQWVADRRHEHRYTWDLIFCDVPTFSNSNRMHASSWDVQRDHADLIISVSRLLSRGGCAIFSCNLRSFKPDIETLEKAGVELVDITAKTISEDFSRNPKIHHAYLVTRREDGVTARELGL